MLALRLLLVESLDNLLDIDVLRYYINVIFMPLRLLLLRICGELFLGLLFLELRGLYCLTDGSDRLFLHMNWLFFNKSLQFWYVTGGRCDGEGENRCCLAKVSDLLLENREQLLELNCHFGVIIAVNQYYFLQIFPVFLDVVVGTVIYHLFDLNQKLIKRGEGITVLEDKEENVILMDWSDLGDGLVVH